MCCSVGKISAYEIIINENARKEKVGMKLFYISLYLKNDREVKFIVL